MNLKYLFKNRNIEVLDIIQFTFKYLWASRESFLNISLPAILILSILSTVLGIFFDPFVQSESIEAKNTLIISSNIIITVLISLPIFSYFMVCFAISWHKYYLMPNQNIKIRDVYKWTEKHTKYFIFLLGLFSIIFILVFISATFLFSILGSGVIFITLVIIIIFTSRLSFVFPATSIGNYASFKSSWERTKGNVIKISLIFGFIWFFTSLFSLLVAQLFQIILGNPISFLGMFVIAFVFRLLSFLSIALLVTALSILYEYLFVQKKTIDINI